MIDVACDEEVVPFYQRLGFIPGRGMMIRRPAAIGGGIHASAATSSGGLADELMAAANELRGIGAEGLRWSANEYDRRRYERIMRLAAELTALRDTRPVDELERMFLDDLALVLADRLGRLVPGPEQPSKLVAIDKGPPVAHSSISLQPP